MAAMKGRVFTSGGKLSGRQTRVYCRLHRSEDAIRPLDLSRVVFAIEFVTEVKPHDVMPASRHDISPPPPTENKVQVNPGGGLVG